MAESSKQFLHRLISRVVPVERDELPALIWSFVYFFCVLAAYYILRPVRDEMGVLSGAHNLPWLFSVVFVTMLAVIPMFGWVAGHFTDSSIIAHRLCLFYPQSFGIFCGFAKWSRVASLWADLFCVVECV